jgi:hypothetical protein
MLWRWGGRPRCKITDNRIEWCNCLLHKEHTINDLPDIKATLKDFQQLAKTLSLKGDL